MKKLLVCLMCMLMVGCTDGYSASKVRKHVKETNPTSECINSIVNGSDLSDFSYICKDKATGTITYFWYGGSELKPTHTEVLFK